MRIGKVDSITTNWLNKRINRNQQQSEFLTSSEQNSILPLVYVQKSKQGERKRKLNTISQQNDDNNGSGYNTKKLKTVSQVADRFRLSNYAAAAVATATLIDYGIVTENNRSNVIDAKKVARSRSVSRKSLINQHKQYETQPTALYFDSRIDVTKKFIDGQIKTVKEDHYSIVEQPGSYFQGFFAINDDEKCGTSKAEFVTNEMMKFSDMNNISLEQLRVVSCDGTVLNTGFRGGIIRNFEVQLGRPLQWLICFVHCNELPLRHLIAVADGATVGPNALAGPIGKKLPSVESLKVVRFSEIEFLCYNSQMQSISHSFSSDQKYLFDICCAISNGKCDENLAKRIWQVN